MQQKLHLITFDYTSMRFAIICGMKSEEIAKEMEMSYEQLVDYLLKKYGAAKYDYFCNETCRSKNKKAARTSEGLFCHHIDEDKAIMLSNDKFALENPYRYQKADRLVYCNILEHLMLHIKIIEMPRPKKANKMEIQGIGGAVNFIVPQINDYYDGIIPKRAYMVTAFELIKYNFTDYIAVLKYLQNVTKHKYPMLKSLVSSKELSRGWKLNIVNRVYTGLTGVDITLSMFIEFILYFFGVILLIVAGYFFVNLMISLGIF